MKQNRWIMTILRVAVGWHFLYEGIAKLAAGNWSAASYLANSTGPLAPIYHWIANSPTLLKITDAANMYGLTLIGLALFLGLAVRPAAVAGAFLLTLYYFAYPPFGPSLWKASEGHLFIVDKLFIEAAVLLLLAFSRETGYGLAALRMLLKRKSREGETLNASRREMLKNLATLPALGVMGWLAGRSKALASVDASTGATIQIGQKALAELKGELPKGKLGPHQISRLVLGGNLIGGWAHSRDLIYVSALFKAYNTEKKIFETLMLAEQAGINAINIGFSSNPLLAQYKKITGSKIKVISQVHPDMEKKDYFVNIDKAIDYGVDIVQVQGNWCDWLVRDQKIDVIAAMLDHIRSQGYVAGLGAHSAAALFACTEQGIVPDYYMKTMHHENYWSAHPREYRVNFEVDGPKSLDHNRFHDNMFDLFPEQTIEFIKQAQKPVMAFKVLAAGAIPPEDGFRWAFENGADFICVGMFDFQIVNDVNITLDVLANLKRSRQWFA
ncbi:MAG: DoxX family protein [candidate division KSB1 bacterium]|nr:DoxX family protein [candidate division KSB1 bacterium]